MSILDVENLSFGFEDKTILKDVSFRLLEGEHAGLVGVNGAGKTTFFNILTGKLIPDKGTVYRSKSVSIGYLDQHSDLKEGKSIRKVFMEAFSSLYNVERKMIAIGDKLQSAGSNETKGYLKELGRLQDTLDSSNFYQIDSLIDSAANGLGLSALGMDTPVDKLSGGQRTKVKLAKLLLENPDLLLLDEPTNYLDKEHIDWLTLYLSNYPKSFIVISHDTNFLNNITNVIFQIEFASLRRYIGNYDAFLKLKDTESKIYIEKYNRQQHEIARMEDFINKNMVRASTTKRAQSRKKQLDKLERLEKPKNNPKSHFSFLMARESGKLVFESSDLKIGYKYPLLSNLNLKLMRGQKIAVTGCNGIGKSTFLKTIMGIIPPLYGKIHFGEYLTPIYFEQEVKTNSNTVMEEVWDAFPRKTQKEIREALAKCGLRQEHVLQKMCSLSGGEQSKVRLCKLMMMPSNWVLLDEPTNHLDVDSKFALKKAIADFHGTVLLVCHEKEFYEDWVTDVWNMENYLIQ